MFDSTKARWGSEGRAPSRPPLGRPGCEVRPLRGPAGAVALLLAATLALIPVAAWADEVDLGISLAPGKAAATSGATGSLDLGVALGTTGASADNDPADGSLDLGIMLGATAYREVRFAGWYCNTDGSIDVERGMETLGEVQRVAQGGCAAAPADAARTYEEGGAELEYWLDGWYAVDPSAHPDAQPVSLDAVDVTQDTVFYCLWKKGYVVKLDPNNGGKDRGGAVASPGCISVPRDETYDSGATTEVPAGFAYADLPAATRPGYVFKGWYWPKTVNGAPVTEDGLVVLDEDKGPVIAEPAPEEGEIPYDFVRDNAGKSLYAKWEVGPVVEIRLADARDAAGNESVYLWFWPGRGYTLEAPRADLELATDAVISSPTQIALVVTHNPVPPYQTQYFGGWGYAKAAAEGETYADDALVTCSKDEHSSAYAYRLTSQAFSSPYVGEGLTWTDAAHTKTDEETGAMTTTFDALFETAAIRVRAPFEVTFEKKGPNWDSDKGDVLPYALDELECAPGEADKWLLSLPQEFANLSDRTVYVSGVECRDVGAGAILPGGAGGKKVFSLYETEGNPMSAKAIAFGYAAAAGANRVTVSPYDPTKWIVLPATEGGVEQPQTLWYGLNLVDAAFDRAAIAVGTEGDGSYVAKIANVKYTYSVVP